MPFTAQTHAESKNRPMAHPRVNRDAAAQVLAKLLGYHQAEADPLLVDVVRLLELAEHLKQVFPVIFTHAYPSVNNSDCEYLPSLLHSLTLLSPTYDGTHINSRFFRHLLLF